MAGQGSGGNVIAALCSFFKKKRSGIGAAPAGTAPFSTFHVCNGRSNVVGSSGMDHPPMVDYQRSSI